MEVIRKLIKTSKNGGAVTIPSVWLQHLKNEGIEPEKMKFQIYYDRIVIYPVPHEKSKNKNKKRKGLRFL